MVLLIYLCWLDKYLIHHLLKLGSLLEGSPDPKCYGFTGYDDLIIIEKKTAQIGVAQIGTFLRDDVGPEELNYLLKRNCHISRAVVTHSTEFSIYCRDSLYLKGTEPVAT